MLGLNLALLLLLRKLFQIVRKFNPFFVAVILLALLMTELLPGSDFIGALILFELICGAMIGYALSGNWKRPLSLAFFFLVLAAHVTVIYLLASEGVDQTVPVSDRFWNQKAPDLSLSDPSATGNYQVKTLFYGSGNDKQRPEYGKEVSLKTDSVDATPFFDQSKGFENKLRKIYWGFTSKNYPLNARVWYPEGKGPFPLVLIVHGNHVSDIYSDPGYQYLGELLASRGFILASIDENFLNGNWAGDYKQQEVFTRGWLLLKHLEQWKAWNQNDSTPFYQKVDMKNIALIGHSRGGAAVAVAAVMNKLKTYPLDAKQTLDFGFSIRGIVQIAPNDPYNPQNEIPLKPENIDYLLLQGAYDQDVSWFAGNRVYNRIRFTDGKDHFKSALYIYKANHGQFNTVWGRTDSGIPISWLLNLKSIMSGEEQRKIAKIYISAFLEASLHGQKNYLSLLKDFREGTKILPKEYYINQFERSSSIYLADYEEDMDLYTASRKGISIQGENLKNWGENALPFRDWGSSQQNCGVYLGWDQKDSTLKGVSSYSISISDSLLYRLKKDSADAFSGLFFFVCNNTNDNDTVDFRIELETPATLIEKSLSDWFILPPPLKTKLTKWDPIYAISKDKPVERVLQYVEIPFQPLIREDSLFNPQDLKNIRFIFDKTTKGEIFLDKVGLISSTSL
jgi:dienelactone hydrolase